MTCSGRNGPGSRQHCQLCSVLLSSVAAAAMKWMLETQGDAEDPCGGDADVCKARDSAVQLTGVFFQPLPQPTAPPPLIHRRPCMFSQQDLALLASTSYAIRMMVGGSHQLHPLYPLAPDNTNCAHFRHDTVYCHLSRYDAPHLSSTRYYGDNLLLQPAVGSPCNRVPARRCAS